METKKNNILLAFIAILSVIGVVSIIGFFLLRPGEEVIQGQVEATEVRISGKVPGRIAQFRVEEGQHVSKGDTLVFLDSPEVYAKLRQAEAVEDAALAQNQKALKGAREEQITSAYEMWQKAKAGSDIARKSYERVRNLFDKGVMSAQKKDEAEANFKAMESTEKATYSQYLMARNGAEKEDKLASEALVNRAKGAVAEVESFLKETFLISPIDGEISEIFPQPGELVGTGAPIMNVMDTNDMYVLFNVREDLLKDIRIGQEIRGYMPALGKELTLKVVHMKDMGNYAAWKATKASGQFDLRTFQVKARPVQVSEGMRPGMTVVMRRGR